MHTDNYNTWDLSRRGQLDQEKHERVLRETVKNNITDLITHGNIIADGKVIMPVKHLRQWKFEYEDDENQEGTATLPDGDFEKGDTIGKVPNKQKGKGNDPGEDEGEDGDGDNGEGYYEVVVDTDSVAEILFEDLELPRMKEKKTADVYKKEYIRDNISKKGIISNLDKKRTIIENMKRNASKGNPVFGDLVDDDLRFRTDTEKLIPQSKVAVIFIRDRSGSMSEEKKHLTRVFTFWITKFLEYKYKKIVEKSFILHDTSAIEVEEDQFITMTEGGGTAISSGFNLAKEIINDKYPPENYNIYIFAFSDGDNMPSDNAKVVSLVKELLPATNLIGYIDILHYYYAYSRMYDRDGLADALENLKEESIIVAKVNKQEDILKGMKKLFKKEGS